MANLTWEINPNWEDLNTPKEGDIVHLKLNGAFDYLVKAIVVEHTSETVTGKVEAFFDAGGLGWVTDSPNMNIVNQTPTWNKQYLHDVIKKP